MGYNAITIHLPDKQKHLIHIFIYWLTFLFTYLDKTSLVKAQRTRRKGLEEEVHAEAQRRKGRGV